MVRILTRPNVGGPTKQALALHAPLAKLGLETVLVVGRCGPSEASVDLAGLPRLSVDQCLGGWPAGGGVVVLDALQRGLAFGADRAASRALGRLLTALAPHVVHTHTSKAGWLGRRAAWRVRRTAERRLVIAHTYHGHVLADYYSTWRTAALRHLEQWIGRRTDLRFAVSPSCRDELAAMGIGPCEVTPPAVDLRSFESAGSETRCGNDPARIGMVGRLVPIKRPQHFAALVAGLRDSVPVVGEVFGDGPLRSELAVADRGELRLHGNVDSLAESLAQLDVLVFTSVREGWPVAAIEAMAAGVPVCGYDVPGVRDALAGIDPDLLAPAGSIGGLGQVVRRLLTDRPWRERVIRQGREQAGRHHPDRIGAQLAAAYDRAWNLSDHHG